MGAPEVVRPRAPRVICDEDMAKHRHWATRRCGMVLYHTGRRALLEGWAPPPPPRGQPTPGVVKQDKSSGGSVDTTKTRSDPQRVRMSSGERPIGAAKGKPPTTEALCQAPPAPTLLLQLYPKARPQPQYPPHPRFQPPVTAPPTDFTARPNRLVTALSLPPERPPLQANPWTLPLRRGVVGPPKDGESPLSLLHRPLPTLGPAAFS